MSEKYDNYRHSLFRLPIYALKQKKGYCDLKKANYVVRLNLRLLNAPRTIAISLPVFLRVEKQIYLVSLSRASLHIRDKEISGELISIAFCGLVVFSAFSGVTVVFFFRNSRRRSGI